jgi:hypothetical protein
MEAEMLVADIFTIYLPAAADLCKKAGAANKKGRSLRRSLFAFFAR